MSKSEQKIHICSFSTNPDGIKPLELLDVFFKQNKLDFVKNEKKRHVKYSYSLGREKFTFIFYDNSNLDANHPSLTKADSYVIFINVDSNQVKPNYMHIISFLRDNCLSEKKIYIVALSYDKQTRQNCRLKENDFTQILVVNGLFYDYQEALWVETNEICNSLDFLSRDNIDAYKKDFRHSRIDLNFEKSQGSCIIV